MLASRIAEVHERLAELRQRVDSLVDVVERPGWSAAAATAGVRTISASVEHLVQQVDALRDLSSLEAARLDEILGVLFGMAGLDFSRRATVGDDGGRLDALAASCNMLSEELEASHRAIEGQNRQLRAATEAKSQFLANMSHEIRTPLGAMLGFADLLLDAELSDSERLNCALVIRRNGEHLLTVINDILDLSKIEAGKLSIERVEFSLPQLLGELESLMQVRAKEKGLSFVVELTTPVPATLVSDPTRIRQVLLNLVGNAIKFTEVGEVRVSVSFDDSEPPTIAFEVSDTGIGMSPEAAAGLFTPFHQADASMSRRFGGTGLGLAICKPLADALDGTISVMSEQGRGSTFRFAMAVPRGSEAPRINSWRDAVQESAGATSESSPTLSGSVLVAEDGVDNQVLITSILRRTGLRVVVAENGAVAVERALAAMGAGSPFDLILMDMQMPELDGYGAASTLRERSYGGPIIALTAHAMAGERERCLAAGCDDYLSKPFDRRELVRRVAAQLGASSGSSGRASPPLTSAFAHDPEMAELINRFVTSLPDRVLGLRTARAEGNMDELRRRAHHLKGAAGGYGFQPITDAAAQLERAITDHGPATVTDALERLALLCASARKVGSEQ